MNLDPEKFKVPAFMRKKAIVRQSRQKLILTALDRKQAGLSVHSQKALAPMKVKKATIKKMRATSYRPAPPNIFFGNDSQTFPPSAPKHLLQDTWPASHRRKHIDQDELENQQQNQFPNPLADLQPQHQAPTGFAEIHPVGHITAYIEKIQVAIIKLEKPLRQGDIIQITADEMLFQQPVDSMQLNRKPIKLAKKGAEIGLKVGHEPQIGGTVYKVEI